MQYGGVAVRHEWLLAAMHAASYGVGVGKLAVVMMDGGGGRGGGEDVSMHVLEYFVG